MQNEIPELMSFNEYAAYLRTSRANLYVLIERKQVPPVFPIGGRRYVRKAVVDTWLAEQEALAA